MKKLFPTIFYFHVDNFKPKRHNFTFLVVRSSVKCEDTRHTRLEQWNERVEVKGQDVLLKI